MTLDQMRNKLRLGIALVLICTAAWVRAQNTTSCAITGTVTDATGAVLPGVQVIVTNQATDLVVTETTNGSGYY
ncbi:MAG: carboxypeptidase-like regulatory domain-containing protein, partial [Terracidiphilus sp.]